MTVVWVDRDSVAMGDDVDSHVERWEVDDATTPAEILLRAADSYLARVSGAVAWTMHLCNGAIEQEEWGPYPRIDDRVAVGMVLLGGAEPRFQTLSRHFMLEPFAMIHDGWTVGDGERLVEFRYHSGGALQGRQAFADRIERDRPRRLANLAGRVQGRDWSHGADAP